MANGAEFSKRREVTWNPKKAYFSLRLKLQITMNTTLSIIDNIRFLLNEQGGSFDQMLNSPTAWQRIRGGKRLSSIKKTQ